ncbi:tRNA (adenosine(37)-N6)-dimethylallyltransferase MiaA [Alkalicoccobacillus plakortidis]|uniref:tRNA dimethylallyltransferase n=1 Tax=Alkalicoccobacillus plakortidis TaxID=444060 RepID=A0ABT0XFJ0_9BACI|nr:tRNA (adenosine(37)-N6)-dimethylallyltransferase MiaA [Alkalicoccobacillus plakortidis]MCM2674661.1 tRNA (adenosine(37)-N6)-dimethylallyltransferase MiaA [Alkalicoccobacillus plakortidis]
MKKLLVIAGPTAVGKSDLGIRLAKELDGEVISGDSMQIYKGMDIGTAKVTTEEMDGVPHHLIDIKEPDEAFSVAEFQERCTRILEDLAVRNKLPIIVGGTGLYIQSITHGYQFVDKPEDKQLRDSLEKDAAQKGNEYVHKLLEEVDAQAAKDIHPNNVRRVIRALEVHQVTGIPFSKQQVQEATRPFIGIGIDLDREPLYQRINNRVDKMIEYGLVAEVQSLMDRGLDNHASAQAIGYKEIIMYLRGECSKAEAIELLKRNSRRYAKRQLTWFRNKMDMTWFDAGIEEKDVLFSQIKNFVEGNQS